MQTVEFEKWVIEVDLKLTRSIYSQIDRGGAEDCGCGQCLDFIARRQGLYPLGALDLLARLGVDPAKEVEVVNLGSVEPGEEVWNWWLLFAGRVVSGPDAAEAGNLRHRMSHIDSLSVGFTEQISLPQEGFRDHPSLVQIEFLT